MFPSASASSFLLRKSGRLELSGDCGMGSERGGDGGRGGGGGGQNGFGHSGGGGGGATFLSYQGLSTTPSLLSSSSLLLLLLLLFNDALGLHQRPGGMNIVCLNNTMRHSEQ